MASNPHRGGAGGSVYGGAAPYRSRDGLSTRTGVGSEEIQLRIDPMQSDLDDEITGLHGQVRQLKNIAKEIGSEAQFQKNFLDELYGFHLESTLQENSDTLREKIVVVGNNSSEFLLSSEIPRNFATEFRGNKFPRTFRGPLVRRKAPRNIPMENVVRIFPRNFVDRPYLPRNIPRKF
uniref:t-SNARE coiled-coil homology domain-containing protein n=1 Tax=Brassica oleracea var. oleracea TaxID=109376 RepID=A0A0D3CEE3_BRAOL